LRMREEEREGGGKERRERGRYLLTFCLKGERSRAAGGKKDKKGKRGKEGRGVCAGEGKKANPASDYARKRAREYEKKKKSAREDREGERRKGLTREGNTLCGAEETK